MDSDGKVDKLVTEKINSKVRVFFEYHAEDEWVERTKRTVTDAMNVLFRAKDYLAIDSGWIARYISRTLRDRQEFHVGKVGKESEYVMAVVPTSEVPDEHAGEQNI